MYFFNYNAEFNDYVNDYCQEVMTIVREDYKGFDVNVYLEEYVTFEDVVPQGGGTSDVVIVGKNSILSRQKVETNYNGDVVGYQLSI